VTDFELALLAILTFLLGMILGLILSESLSG
jgi:hypothetical protein